MFTLVSGEYFDIREFHDQVLRLGPVPLKTLEYYIGNWIEQHAPPVESNAASVLYSGYSVLWTISIYLCYILIP